MVAGELERGRWGQMPPMEWSRCSSLTLVRTRVLFRTLRLEHLPQVLPLFDPRLPLTLPKGRGGSDLLLHLPCHLSKIKGLRWQRAFERGCLAHREIAGYRLFHRGIPHSHFTHPLNVSITSMLKPMNVRKNSFFHSFSTSAWRSERKGRLTRAGGLWPEWFLMLHNLQ